MKIGRRYLHCYRFIKNYPEKASRQQYSPHVTIGFGDFNRIKDMDSELKHKQLELDHLLFGQLGNFCSMGKKNFLQVPLNEN